MSPHRTLIAFCVFALAAAPAQSPQALTTLYAQNGGCTGNMFDVVATNDITVCSFDVSLDPMVTATVEVWAVTGGGSWQPVGSTPGAWTRLAVVSGIQSSGLNVPTSLDLSLGFDIPIGTTQGFYLVCTNVAAMNHTAGPTTGAVVASNADLQILAGAGDCSLAMFSPFTTRHWNGTIHYMVGLGQTCPPPPPLPWQTNSDAATLTVDGAPDPGRYEPLTTVVGSNATASLEILSTQLGLPWDLGFTIPEPGLPLAAGATVTPGNQTVNLDIAAPSFQTLNGLNSAVPYPGPMTIPMVGLPVGFAGSAQSLHQDPSAFDGFVLGHLNRFEVRPCLLFQDFEALPPNIGSTTASGPFPVGWSPGPGSRSFQVAMGPTASPNTGPLLGAFSGTQYIYCETSGNLNTTFTLDTCSYDVSSLTSFTLAFRLSRIGATIGVLEVRSDDGTGAFATTLATFSGPEPTGTDWTLETLPFVATGSVVGFRFVYTSGASFTGDLALDDFDLR